MTRLAAALLALALGLAGCGSARAQSNPNPLIIFGMVPTPDQWNLWFRQKQDYLGFTPFNPANTVGSSPIVVSFSGGTLTISCPTCLGSGGGFDSNVLNVNVSSNYTISTPDCGKTMQMGSSSGTDTQVLNVLTAGVSGTCSLVVTNANYQFGGAPPGHAHFLDVQTVAGTITQRLYPGQSIGLKMVNGFWAVTTPPGRWKAPKGNLFIYYNPGGTDAFGTNDCLYAAEPCIAGWSQALGRVINELDFNGDGVASPSPTRVNVRLEDGQTDRVGVHYSPHDLVGAQGGQALRIIGAKRAVTAASGGGGSNFAVSVSTTGYSAGMVKRIQGCSTDALNNLWRIASIGSGTVTLDSTASFTATISPISGSQSLMTVTAVSSTGIPRVGQVVSGSGVTGGTAIASVSTAFKGNGLGTYVVSNAQTVSTPTAMTASVPSSPSCPSGTITGTSTIDTRAVGGGSGSAAIDLYYAATVEIEDLALASDQSDLALEGAGTRAYLFNVTFGAAGSHIVLGNSSTVGFGDSAGLVISAPASTAFISASGPSSIALGFGDGTRQAGIYFADAASYAITSLTWSLGVATATTTAPHGVPTGSPFQANIVGVTPSGYDVTGVTATSTGASTFTYPLASNPGASPASVPGSYVAVNMGSFLSAGSGANVSFQNVPIYQLNAAELINGFRFQVNSNAVVTSGGNDYNLNYFPGNIAGVLASGGIYDNNCIWNGSTCTPTGYRRQITANAFFNVRQDGSDACDGTVNLTASPFPADGHCAFGTVGKCYTNAVATLDFNGLFVNCQVRAAGGGLFEQSTTHVSGATPIVGGSPSTMIIQGDGSSSVTLQQDGFGQGIFSFQGRNVGATILGVKLQGFAAGRTGTAVFAQDGGKAILATDVNYGDYSTNIASFSASISGTVMTVTGSTTCGAGSGPTCPVSVGMPLSGTGLATGTSIASNGTGTGGAGTYNVTNGPLALSSLSWTGGTVTATTAAPHGVATSNTFTVTISGAVPGGYNSTNVTATATSANQFTYPKLVNPGPETTPGSYTVTGQNLASTTISGSLAAGNHIGAQFDGVVLAEGGSYTISGSAATHITGSFGSTIATDGSSYTLTGTPGFGVFINLQSQARARMDNMSFSGASNNAGAQCSIATLSYLQTNAQPGHTPGEYFPGSGRQTPPAACPAATCTCNVTSSSFGVAQ